MCDIIALAFQTDRTRIATMLLTNNLSGQVYPFLGLRDDHHSFSHNCHGREFASISRFWVEQYGYLLGRLAATQEGDGTVLDNSCLMFLSNMWIGRKHDNARLPVVLAGGLGGTLQTGRSLSYLDQPDEKRRICGLYLSLMDRYGIKQDKFGDATARLEHI
jgi:hypothetical protein